MAEKASTKTLKKASTPSPEEASTTMMTPKKDLLEDESMNCGLGLLGPSVLRN